MGVQEEKGGTLPSLGSPGTHSVVAWEEEGLGRQEAGDGQGRAEPRL